MKIMEFVCECVTGYVGSSPQTPLPIWSPLEHTHTHTHTHTMCARTEHAHKEDSDYKTLSCQNINICRTPEHITFLHITLMAHHVHLQLTVCACIVVTVFALVWPDV